MNNHEPVKRPYRSRIRSAQAEQTRAAIVAAATDLYARRGYVATTIDDVAAAAGVSRATVFNAVGGKPDLLIRAYQVAVRGDEADIPLGRQERSRRILAEEDQHRLLAGYAGVVAEAMPRIAPLYEAIRAAAHADAEARGLWKRITGERRYGAGRVVRALKRRGPLRPGLDSRTATDLLWVLNDPSLYHLLVEERRWTRRRFRDWLTDAMRTQLLAPQCDDDSGRHLSRRPRA